MCWIGIVAVLKHRVCLLPFVTGLHQKHTIRNNWPESTTEVSLLPVMAPGDREQVILLVDLPQVDQPDVHFKVLKVSVCVWAGPEGGGGGGKRGAGALQQQHAQHRGDSCVVQARLQVAPSWTQM